MARTTGALIMIAWSQIQGFRDISLKIAHELIELRGNG